MVVDQVYSCISHVGEDPCQTPGTMTMSHGNRGVSLQFHTILLVVLCCLKYYLDFETEILYRISNFFFLVTYHKEFDVLYWDKISSLKYLRSLSASL